MADLTQKKPHGRLPYAARNAGTLEGLYDELNVELFRGKLPRAVVRWVPWEKIGPYHGTTHVFSALGPSIWVNEGMPGVVPRPRGAKLRRILLHEMCHVAAPGSGDYEKKFLAQLKRLAARGERWAEREATEQGTRLQELTDLLWEMDAADEAAEIERLGFGQWKIRNEVARRLMARDEKRPEPPREGPLARERGRGASHARSRLGD